MMRHPVEERSCHLGIAEDGDPLAELQVGGDDDAGWVVFVHPEITQLANFYQLRDTT